MNIVFWLFQPEVWIIAGIILIAAEVLDGSTIFFLPFGVGALLNAILIGQQANTSMPDLLIFNDWWEMLVSWAVLALVASLILRMISRYRSKSQDADINEY